jgi:hypothetical protein
MSSNLTGTWKTRVDVPTQDIKVDVIPATSTKVAQVDITSRNGNNLSSVAFNTTGQTDGFYMVFEIRDLGAPTAGTLKNVIVGFARSNNPSNFNRGDIETRGTGFVVKGDMLIWGNEKLGNGGVKAAVKGNNSKASSTFQPVANLKWNPSMVFTIHYSGGFFSYFANDILLGKIQTPVGAPWYAFVAPYEEPSTNVGVKIVSLGSVAQGGGFLPECTTYCDPTKVYTASAAQASSARASSAAAELRASAAAGVARASSAAAQIRASAAAGVARASSAAAEMRASSAAGIARASSAAAVLRASSARAEEMKYFDAGKTLALALGTSIQVGQAPATPAVAQVQPTVVAATRVINAQGGGRRRRSSRSASRSASKRSRGSKRSKRTRKH